MPWPIPAEPRLVEYRIMVTEHCLTGCVYLYPDFLWSAVMIWLDQTAPFGTAFGDWPLPPPGVIIVDQPEDIRFSEFRILW